MANEALASGPVDPLHGLVGLSLFPKTIRVCTDVSVDPKDLESVHNFMKSLETKSPVKLFEEARTIVNNGAELLNTKFMGIDGDVAMNGKEKLKERRPGLGRRKPQFTFKPSTSQPPVILGSTLESLELDMDQLEDPVEFFAAAERLEEAEKEMKRLKGISINEDMNIPLANSRRRRPGILNKSVRYKHRFSSIQSESDNAFISSQETLRSDTRAGLNSQLSEESHGLNVELQEADSPGSVEKTENRNNSFLDELLSISCEDLNGEMILLSKLQERLQIKPFELGPLCIPELPMTGKADGKAFGQRIRKPWKFSLEIQDLVKSPTEGTSSTHRQHEESPANNLASPTPSKSPHASLSLLKQKILKSNPLRDPFSPLNIDLYNNDSQSDHPPDWSMKRNPQCISNNAGPTKSHGETENVVGFDNTNIMVPLSGSDSSHEQLMKNGSGEDNIKTGPNGSQSGKELENGYDDIDINTDINLNMRNMDSHYESDVLGKVNDVSVVNNVMKDQQGLQTESSFSCQKMQDGEVLAETLSSPHAQRKAGDTHNYSVETVAADSGSSEIDWQVDHMPPQRENSAEQDHHFEDSVKDVTSVVNDVMKDQQGLQTESSISCQKMQDGEVLAETLSSPQAQRKADDTHNYSIETVAADSGSSEIDRQVDHMRPQRERSAEQVHHFEDSFQDVTSVVNDVMKDQQGLQTESSISCQKMQDGEVLAETLSSPQAQRDADDTHNYSVETVAADSGSSEIDRQVDHMPPQREHSAELDHHFEDSVKDVTSDQLRSVAVEVHSTEVGSILSEMSPQHYAQAKDKQEKAKRPAGGRRETKALRPRPSLADAGTSFQDGVRRSKRMKTRPLEYWKGERLLYGWVNDSLKLVGVKYVSPIKGSVKVESYISDDYKDLVELAARY